MAWATASTGARSRTGPAARGKRLGLHSKLGLRLVTGLQRWLRLRLGPVLGREVELKLRLGSRPRVVLGLDLWLRLGLEPDLRLGTTLGLWLQLRLRLGLGLGLGSRPGLEVALNLELLSERRFRALTVIAVEGGVRTWARAWAMTIGLGT